MLSKWTLWIQNLARPLACVSYLTSLYWAPHLQMVTTAPSFMEWMWGSKVVTYAKGLTHSKCATDTGDYYFAFIILEKFNHNSSNKTNPPYPFFFPSISKCHVESAVSPRFLFPHYLLNPLIPLSSHFTPLPIIMLFLSPREDFFTLTSLPLFSFQVCRNIVEYRLVKIWMN